MKSASDSISLSHVLAVVTRYLVVVIVSTVFGVLPDELALSKSTNQAPSTKTIVVVSLPRKARSPSSDGDEFSGLQNLLDGEMYDDYLTGEDLEERTTPLGTVQVRAGRRAMMPCPGLNASVQVKSLEWWCKECAILDATASAAGVITKSLVLEEVLVYSAEGGLRIARDPGRIGLLTNVFSLTFKPVKLEDDGNYHCFVNGDRRFDMAVRLEVQDVPTPPGKPLITGYTSRSANLSWAPPADTNNSPLSHYIIFVRDGGSGENSSPSKSDWKGVREMVVEGDKTFAAVPHLRPFSIYDFRVAAVNGIGRSQHSEPTYHILTLREKPSEKPVISSARNASSTSIHLEWTAPSLASINGEFLGYKVTYAEAASEGSVAASAAGAGDERDLMGAAAGTPAGMSGIVDSSGEVEIRDPNITSFTLHDLRPFTTYYITLQAVNPEGAGPPDAVVVRTDEGVPSQPVTVLVRRVTKSSVVLSWSEPEIPQGNLAGYRVYYKRDNFTDVRTIPSTAPLIKYKLDGLRPNTPYLIWVKAFTWKHEGTPSAPVAVTTRNDESPSNDDSKDPLGSSGIIGGAEEFVFGSEQSDPVTSGSNSFVEAGSGSRPTRDPYGLNISCDAEDQSLYLSWHGTTGAGQEAQKGPDHFYVYLLDGSGKTYKEFVVSAHQHQQRFQIHISNLTLARLDSVFLRGAAKDGTTSQLEFVGPPVGRQVESYCTNPKTMPDISSMREENGTLFVAIVAGASLVVLLVAIMSAALLCRRRAETIIVNKWNRPNPSNLLETNESGGLIGSSAGSFHQRYVPSSCVSTAQVTTTSIDGWWGACSSSLSVVGSSQQQPPLNRLSASASSHSITTTRGNSKGVSAALVTTVKNTSGNDGGNGASASTAAGNARKSGANGARNRPVPASGLAELVSALMKPDGTSTPILKHEYKACVKLAAAGQSKAANFSKKKAGTPWPKSGIFVDGWRIRRQFVLVAAFTDAATGSGRNTLNRGNKQRRRGSNPTSSKLTCSDFGGNAANDDEPGDSWSSIWGQGITKIVEITPSKATPEEFLELNVTGESDILVDVIDHSRESSSWCRKKLILRKSNLSKSSGLPDEPQQQQRTVEFWKYFAQVADTSPLGICATSNASSAGGRNQQQGGKDASGGKLAGKSKKSRLGSTPSSIEASEQESLARSLNEFLVRSMAVVADGTQQAPILLRFGRGCHKVASCYVVLCTLIHQFLATGEVDVFGFCRYIREQDPSLMPSEDFYAFVYYALSTALPVIPSNLLAVPFDGSSWMGSSSTMTASATTTMTSCEAAARANRCAEEDRVLAGIDQSLPQLQPCSFSIVRSTFDGSGNHSLPPMADDSMEINPGNFSRQNPIYHSLRSTSTFMDPLMAAQAQPNIWIESGSQIMAMPGEMYQQDQYAFHQPVQMPDNVTWNPDVTIVGAMVSMEDQHQAQQGFPQQFTPVIGDQHQLPTNPSAYADFTHQAAQGHGYPMAAASEAFHGHHLQHTQEPHHGSFVHVTNAPLQEVKLSEQPNEGAGLQNQPSTPDVIL